MTMGSKIKCMECGKEYGVPCYGAQFHEHNRWEMTDKSTEARQDELAGIREKIAQDIYFEGEKYEVGSIAELTWRKAPQARKDKYLKRADQILSLPVNRGGMCPECKGVKKIQYGKKGVNPIYFVKCPVCNGTGRTKVVEKTLGQLVKEHQDG